ncbi:AAA family ATPase [Candidatus Parcubacteria bacterium]|uniref:(d)CMP kinase n=1 Tax=Candidatus Kaiserbacteria bacterium CG10_big_fil_rev_8_21_14_0_10_47_16 TaxID=1974608 RepID=A0A2H0UE09_9BACT|nr:AAA family ATPase [Candidatus Parcubacteria bacterium]PIR84590.1 MAG: hypothetical protein COU16_03385 [Candidatus Kaiserbacteria bacterium CG10_big_fil_rev_8_21_14_0_10_47_16]
MPKRTIITLGGMPGSGKSTIREMLATQLGYKTFSTGNFTRHLAKERGITLQEMNEIVAKDKALEMRIDAELERIEAEENNIIVDSHLAFHFVPSSFKVYFDISLDEATRRIFNDTGAKLRVESGDIMETLEATKERTLARIENHRSRYKEHYGLNPYDGSQYDLVVNTEESDPEAITDAVVAGYKKWLKDE